MTFDRAASSSSHLFGVEAYEKIKNSKILLIGAGGIGCEILKNLALVGAVNVTVIDLDTIDVSNLNRQFLFRPCHINQSKAKIAAETTTNLFNPLMNISAYQDNIKSSTYSVTYFLQFDLVLNALDNVEARRHVNRLALSANVPLLDTGTQGYLGQVVPIIKHYTCCYECFPKKTQKVYPVCTIRSTPEKPVHCVVWAKELYKFFYYDPSTSILYDGDGSNSSQGDDVEIPEDFKDHEDDKELSVFFKNKPSFNTTIDFSNKTLCKENKEEFEKYLDYIENVIVLLFNKEITKKIAMGVYKTAKFTPHPLSLELIHIAREKFSSIYLQDENSKGSFASDDYASPNWQHAVNDLETNLIEFFLAFCQLPLLESRPELEYENSNDKIVHFTTTAANLRAEIFSIERSSFYHIKGIAGNIIPAIATTNSIIGSTVVLMAMRLIINFKKEDFYELEDSTEETKEEKKKRVALKLKRYLNHTYCLRFCSQKGYYLHPTSFDEPKENCYVCGNNDIYIQLDTNKTSLETFINKVLKKSLGFNEPTISSGSNIFYEEGEDSDETLLENLPLMLSKCPGGGITDGTTLEISDFSQNLDVNLIISHVDEEILLEHEDTAVDLFKVSGNVPKPIESKEKEKEDDASATTTSSAPPSSSTSAVIIDEDFEIVEPPTKKSKV